MLPRPLVRLPPAPEPLPDCSTDAPPLQPAAERPTTATALPQALIGAVIGATIWFPPRMLWSPLVRLPPAPEPLPDCSTDAPPTEPASDSPMTATELPLMSI